MTIPKKSALGKGLSALLSNDATDITSKSDIAAAPAVAGSVANIAIDKIETNPFQPRTDFEEHCAEGTFRIYPSAGNHSAYHGEENGIRSVSDYFR